MTAADVCDVLLVRHPHRRMRAVPLMILAYVRLRGRYISRCSLESCPLHLHFESLNFLQDLIDLLLLYSLVASSVFFFLLGNWIGDLVVNDGGLSFLEQTLFKKNFFDDVVLNYSGVFSCFEAFKFVLKDIWSHFSENHFKVDSLLVKLVSNKPLFFKSPLLFGFDLFQSLNFEILFCKVLV
jgi:hypothetical protein